MKILLRLVLFCASGPFFLKSSLLDHKSQPEHNAAEGPFTNDPLSNEKLLFRKPTLPGKFPTVQESVVEYDPLNKDKFLNDIKLDNFISVPLWTSEQLFKAFSFIQKTKIIEGSCRKGCYEDKHLLSCRMYPDRCIMRYNWRNDCEARALTINLALYSRGFARLRDDVRPAPKIRFEWKASHPNQIPQQLFVYLKDKKNPALSSMTDNSLATASLSTAPSAPWGMPFGRSLTPSTTTTLNASPQPDEFKSEQEKTGEKSDKLPFLPANIFVFRGPEKPIKTFVSSTGKPIVWQFHVVPLVKVKDINSAYQYKVIDLVMNSQEPILLDKWLGAMRDIKSVAICTGLAWQKEDACRGLENQERALEEADFLDDIFFSTKGRAIKNPVVSDIRSELMLNEKIMTPCIERSFTT